MAKRLSKRENKLLLYFRIATEGCRNYIKTCEYTPYNCGYSEPRKDLVTVYELCLFAAGVIKCPGEIEKRYADTHNKSSYRANLRAIASLEKKGYIRKETNTGSRGEKNSKWFMRYNLIGD